MNTTQGDGMSDGALAGSEADTPEWLKRWGMPKEMDYLTPPDEARACPECRFRAVLRARGGFFGPGQTCRTCVPGEADTPHVVTG